MLLTERNSAPGDFYVPGASICIGMDGANMRERYGMHFTQVEVDLQVSVQGTFRFTIPRAFDNERSDFSTPSGDPLMPLIKLGARVWIRMGYGDLRATTPLISGYITAVSTGFAEGGAPDIEVTGMDATFVMTLGTSEHRLENRTVQDAVQEVAQKNGLSLDFSGNAPANITLDSNLQSDLDFLRKVVEIFSKSGAKWEFFARSSFGRDMLVVRPRTALERPLLTLVWGGDLISFKPEINLGNQVQSVKVYGWDEVKKKEIIGTAPTASGPKSEPSGGDILRSAFGRDAVLELRLPVKTQQEADQRAAAAFANRSNDLLKGEGETFGRPDLLPDSCIELTGIGQQFSTCYYVAKTVHRYDTTGYRTRFSVERPVA